MRDGFGDFNQAWIRAVMILAVLVPIGLFRGSFHRILSNDWKWFWIISLAGGLNQAPYYFAFRELEIGTATLLFYSTLTISGYMLGKLVFAERISMIKYIALVLALLGISILFTFSIHVSQLFPAFCAILAGAMGGVEVVLTKKISNRYSTLQILTAVFAAMVIGNGVLSAGFGEGLPGRNANWLAQTGYAFSMLGAMYFVVKGFQNVEASLGSLFGITEILFAIIFGLIFFGEFLSPDVVIGSFLIVMAAILPEVRAYIRELKEAT